MKTCVRQKQLCVAALKNVVFFNNFNSLRENGNVSTIFAKTKFRKVSSNGNRHFRFNPSTYLMRHSTIFNLVNLSQYRAGIFKKSMGARHRVRIGLSYRPARLHRLAELMPRHRFLGSIKV